ncbi:MAG: hypothetical protein AAGA89_10540 [Pseudomonadota bacterium]
MSLENYPSLSSWIGRYSQDCACVSPDVAKTPEGRAALSALNELAELLKRGDQIALEELMKMRQRDEWLRSRHCADDETDEFYDIPQTD